MQRLVNSIISTVASAEMSAEHEQLIEYHELFIIFIHVHVALLAIYSIHACRVAINIRLFSFLQELLSPLIYWLIMLKAVIYYIVTVILTKKLVITTDQCTEYQFKSTGVSCEDIYNKNPLNPESHQCSGYYWIVKRVFCGMTYTGSSCEHIYIKYPEIYKNNPKERSRYYHLNNKQCTYCNMTEIAANDDDFISTYAAVNIIKSTYQSFLPGESCESIYI